MSDDVTRLMLMVFRAEAALTEAVDRLVADLDLTRARWQVLGALDALGGRATLSQVGRAMGLSRQSVRRTAQDLERTGFLAFKPNPAHARAKLAVFTEPGRAAFAEARRRQARWSADLASGLPPQAFGLAHAALESLVGRLDADTAEDQARTEEETT